jgi:hypothetical protein
MKWFYFLLGTPLIFFVCLDVRADDETSLRISRPAFRMPPEMRFSEGRLALNASHFALWRRNYLRPVICTSVLCGGSCAAFLDSCPSFTGLAVLDFGESANSNLSVDSEQRCPVNVPRGLVASDGCGYTASSCESSNESSMKGSCCSP